MENPTDRTGIFTGDDPHRIAATWLADAEKTEPNDPNAVSLATVDASGMPNVRRVLLKEIEPDGFIFYTNYDSRKAAELDGAGKAALLLHSKTLRRQIRARGLVSKEDGEQADTYFASRSLKSRLGAWASRQSKPLTSREKLMLEVAKHAARLGPNPRRPAHWGGYRLKALEIEFWADGAHRLHDRFRWTRETLDSPWSIERLYP